MSAFKRILAFLLSAVMVVCIVPSYVGAVDEEYDPVIILQGYSGPQLYFENGERAWGINTDRLAEAVIEAIPKIVFGAVLNTLGYSGMIDSTLEALADEFLGPIEMNKDGSSVNKLSPYPTGIYETSYASFVERDEEYCLAEPLISKDIIEYVGADRYFTFVWDWRQSQVDSAAQLREYIKQVKAYTGSDKIDIYSLSHGGQLCATYLFYYGTDGDVDNAVLNVPAIGGSSITSDLLYGESINFDFKDICTFAQIGLRSELEIQDLVGALIPPEINGLMLKMAKKYLYKYIKYIGSVWDLVPASDYDALKKMYLDETESAALIAKSDEMHYNVMKNMGEGLRRAQAAGVDISIMTSTGHRLGSGAEENSDYIVNTSGSSGAFCAKVGSTFAPDYTPLCTVCSNPEHYHISPAFDVDASCAYLPENTWFINEQFHGQVHWDSHSHDLFMKLLLTDDLPDVWADKEFPQFWSSSNPADTIFFGFDNSRWGYLDSGDSALIINNTSEKYAVRILGVQCDGSDIDFNFKPVKVACGDSTAISFAGSPSLKNRSQVTVTVRFLQLSGIPAVKSRSLTFTSFTE